MAEDKLIQIFVSPDILKEINRVLEHEKIVRILKRSGTQPSSIMTRIFSLSSLVEGRVTVKAIEEDSADNRILSCAKEARAQFIVSSNHHLLQLGMYDNIRILSASSFLRTQNASR